MSAAGHGFKPGDIVKILAGDPLEVGEEGIVEWVGVDPLGVVVNVVFGEGPLDCSNYAPQNLRVVGHCNHAGNVTRKAAR